MQKLTTKLFVASLFLISQICNPSSASEVPTVVKIINQSEPGSGFFIKVGGKTYLLTSKHVLGSTGEDVTAQLLSGLKIKIPIENQFPMANSDAAVMHITNPAKDLIPFSIRSQPNINIGEQMTVWGYPVSTSDHAELQKRSGAYKGSPTKIEDGYSILYGASTQKGFSGGPVLDGQGLVVGIHGRSEGSRGLDGSEERTGNALAIPIDVILQSLNSTKSNKSIVEQAGRHSMKIIAQILKEDSMSDQVILELKRVANSSISPYCIKLAKAYYYSYYSKLPYYSKATNEFSVKAKNAPKVYFAFASLISKKSGDFEAAVDYKRRAGGIFSSPKFRSERGIKKSVLNYLDECSK